MAQGSTRRFWLGLTRAFASQASFNEQPCHLISASKTSASSSSSPKSMLISDRRRWSSPLHVPTRSILTIHRENPNIEREESARKQLTESSILSPEQATKISLRSARPDDCGGIMKLLRDFAAWEDSLDNLEITEEDLLRDGFGDLPFYRCVVAEAQGRDDVTSLVAYGMYNFIYCAWKGRMVTFEDIYVHQAYRGFGLGAIVLHQVSKHAYNLGCRRVTGYVDDNDPNLPRWYQGYGFVDFSRQFDYHIYSLSDDPLEKFVHNHDPFTKPNNLGLDIDSLL
ncbi:thialysine N-epsilon-acetyltransferase-like [Lytechinus variegatus]|uniref:thialysine N-epsilon-acetyltransferase-like n=1 Tax=Lytechinus variegatus TaxID=7654 RepID=UPI001BB1117B|nr:thialysine N-epsilon-acetyltransferase-like [Lytechinus variegatus]